RVLWGMEDEPVRPTRVPANFPQDLTRGRDQRNIVRSTHLHPFGWDGPYRRFEVDLIPSGKANLDGSCKGVRLELQGQTDDGAPDGRNAPHQLAEFVGSNDGRVTRNPRSPNLPPEHWSGIAGSPVRQCGQAKHRSDGLTNP